ncbi:doublecortin domain-containing protein 1-like isoform X2 [Passer domesticus]|uniref:doublecortin domain-containing protein 1-like isoform X2 n=1 Tax=Passer domesticus TaxID=48849 RepID=UPI0030FE0B70
MLSSLGSPEVLCELHCKPFPTELAYPEFVLTYLEELNEREEVTQTENHIHHGAWAAAHQETDSSSAEEVTALSQRQVLGKKKKTKNVINPNQKQLSGPLDAHLMPADPLGQTAQLTVALVRKLEEKHPKAPAQSRDLCSVFHPKKTPLTVWLLFPYEHCASVAPLN